VLLIFNCPELIATDPCTCAAAKPKAVLIVSDGPRASRRDDKINCPEVRKTLQEAIAWEAKVMANFFEESLGRRKRISSGLTRSFGQVDLLLAQRRESEAFSTYALPCAIPFLFCETFVDVARYGYLSIQRHAAPQEE
jgi:hypothetical protein